MERERSRTRWIVGLCLAAAAAFAIGLWRAEPQAPPGPEGPEASRPEGAADVPAVPAPRGAEAAAPEHRIPLSGRLGLSAEELPATGLLTLALELPYEARGDEAPGVQVASQDGRRIPATATLAPEAEGGVHVAIDPHALRPGRYMIQVETAEATHFPIRRYALEIR